MASASGFEYGGSFGTPTPGSGNGFAWQPTPGVGQSRAFTSPSQSTDSQNPASIPFQQFKYPATFQKNNIKDEFQYSETVEALSPEHENPGIRALHFFKIVVGSLIGAAVSAPASGSPFLLVLGIGALFNTLESFSVKGILESKDGLTRTLFSTANQFTPNAHKSLDELTAADKEQVLPIASAFVTGLSALFQSLTFVLFGSEQRRAMIEQGAKAMTRGEFVSGIKGIVGHSSAHWGRRTLDVFKHIGQFIGTSGPLQLMRRNPILTVASSVLAAVFMGYAAGEAARRVGEKQREVLEEGIQEKKGSVTPGQLFRRSV